MLTTIWTRWSFRTTEQWSSCRRFATRSWWHLQYHQAAFHKRGPWHRSPKVASSLSDGNLRIDYGFILFHPEDLCDPNPCGPNARCEPGYDRYHQDRPVCTCHTGYTGDPLIGCIRGECTEDSHCGDSQACIDYRWEMCCLGQVSIK